MPTATARAPRLHVRPIRFERPRFDAIILLAVMQEHLGFIPAMRQRDGAAVALRLARAIDSAQRRVMGLPRPPLPWSTVGPEP